MTKICTIGTLALAVALVAGVSDVSALTLGRLRGSALLGQPIDVTVPVQTSGDEDPAQACFEADVFYGDGHRESGQITTSVQSGASSQTVQVRIRTSARVDEPVVTVYLKSVCGQKTSKRYVLLADLASEVTPPVAPVVPAAPLVLSVPVAKSTAGAERASASQGTVASKTTNKAAATANAPKPQPAKLPKPVGSQPVSKARLKLTPLELGPERDPVLRSSDELTSAPAEDLQKRVEALAMWRALNASAQDILKEEARMQALEGDLKRLGDMTAKNRQSLQDVTSRLEQSEAQRYANPLVYALVVGLMACLAAMVLLWQRLRRAGATDRPWWGAQDDVDAQSRLQEELEDEQGPLTEVMTDRGSGTSVSTSVESRPVVPHDSTAVDIDLEMGESVFAPPHVVSPAFKPSQPGDFLPSAAGALRAINSKEMLDVRQQAEFFMTLGQYEDAIGLLEASIRGATQSSPLVYLDLLKILHTLSRKQEFERYRAEFNHLFTGIVPPYASFHEEGRGLDAYPELRSKLVAFWATKEVVQFIEHCMVRAPGSSPDVGLEMEAFRELLMLHAVAQKLHGAGDSGPAHESMGSTDFNPVTTSSLPSIPEGGAAHVPMPVDFDLSDQQPAGNLIDFEISDYIKNGDSGKP